MPETKIGLPSDEELKHEALSFYRGRSGPIVDELYEYLREVRKRTLLWAANECSETAAFTKDQSARYTARQLRRTFVNAAKGDA